jgi:hypothetical protein
LSGLECLAAIERQPFFVALAASLERCVGQEAMATLNTGFVLGEQEELRTLIYEAGFEDVRVRLRVRQMRYSPLEAYIPGQLQATPMAEAVAALDIDTRQAMIRGTIQALKPYIDDDGLAAPMECQVVAARV